MNNLILFLITGMLISELLLEISLRKLMLLFNKKTPKEFSNFYLDVSKSTTKYNDFMLKIKQNKINQLALIFFNSTNTVYFIIMLMALGTKIYYVSLGLIIMTIIKITIKKDIYWIDKIMSLIIISSGVLVFLK